MTRPALKRLAVAGALLAGLAVFLAFDLARFVDLAAWQAAQGRFAEAYAARPGAVAGGFFALYVLVTAVSLPGATVLTLAAGALFGLATGSVIVSLASTLGATLAMLAARTLLREPVRSRWPERAAAIDRGIARDGAFHLVALRLVPLVPFFAVNLLMGLTAMRVRTYAFASWAAMLPATLVYVNAGTQLASLRSVADVASPGLLASFVALAALPFAARWGVGRWRERRVLAPWAAARPRGFERNLVVVGAGAAGLVASLVAAATRAKVTLVERGEPGGDCLNTGCVPSKALIRAAGAAHEARRAGAAFGVDVDGVRVDFARVMAHVKASIAAIAPHDSAERFRGLGVEVLAGEARLIDPWRVAVRPAGGGSERVLTTKAIVIATGAEPVWPPLAGLAEARAAGRALSSETLWGLEVLPSRLVVMGGGPIGCELAQAFARLGSAVTLVEAGPRLLPREDAAVSEAVARALAADGVALRCGWRARACEALDGAAAVRAADAGDGAQGAEAPSHGQDGAPAAFALRIEPVAGAGGEGDGDGDGDGVRAEALPFDRLLVAVGRRARLAGFGLEALGLVPEDGAPSLATDAFLRTRLPHVLLAGDVAGRGQYTHLAGHHGWYAAVNALFAPFKRFAVDERVVPACTFTSPEVARVGLNEQDARARGIAFEATRYELSDFDRAIVDGAACGFVQVLTPPGRDRILGATIVGAHAGETIASFALAMKHGLGLRRLLGTVHAYPTWAESAKLAAGAWQRAHVPRALLGFAERWHAWRRK